MIEGLFACWLVWALWKYSSSEEPKKLCKICDWCEKNADHLPVGSVCNTCKWGNIKEIEYTYVRTIKDN